jgi:hypothetical protein
VFDNFFAAAASLACFGTINCEHKQLVRPSSADVPDSVFPYLGTQLSEELDAQNWAVGVGLADLVRVAAVHPIHGQAGSGSRFNHGKGPASVCCSHLLHNRSRTSR